MANFLTISPQGLNTPDLFPSFVGTFKRDGHLFVGDIKEANIVLFDLHTRIGVYEDSIIQKAHLSQKPIVTFSEYDYGGMAKDVWPDPLTSQQKVLFDGLDETNSVHFVRKMIDGENYPSNVFPYEKCIMHDSPLVSKEDLFSRPYDLCFIGNTSPQRKSFIEGLQSSGRFKMIVHWTNEEGKMPHDEWLWFHSQAKMFIESDGGGFGSERPHQLLTIAPMLKQKNNQLVVHPFIDRVDCLEANETPNPNDVDKILHYLNNQDDLFRLYLAGAENLRTNYTEEGRAKYFLEVIKNNLHE